MSIEEIAEWFLSSSDYYFYSVLLALLIFVLLLWYFFAYFCYSLTKDKVLPKGTKKYRYAVFVPARNEDKVIGNCLKSLKMQTYDPNYFDVYVIVESKNDPTVKITKKYGYSSIIRKDLVNKRTKGYALDEAYKYINELKDKTYDSIIVFDADNVVANDYIDLLNDVKNQGFKVGMGFRNFTNSTKNWVSACSATLFGYMNQFTSKGRSQVFKKLTLIGTGYYIDKDIIDAEGGWIFNGMTEDVEITRYCYYHNISMKYYPIAQYYDEQPEKFKVVHTQHIRWVWGYFANKKRFSKKNNPDYKCLKKGAQNISLFEYNVSIYPIVCIYVLLLLSAFASFIVFLVSIPYTCIYEEFRVLDVTLTLGFYALVYFVLLWGVFAFVAFITIIISNKFLHFNVRTSLKVMSTYVFFMFDFVLAVLDGLIHRYKRTSWDKVEHKGNVSNKKALEQINNEKGKK